MKQEVRQAASSIIEITCDQEFSLEFFFPIESRGKAVLPPTFAQEKERLIARCYRKRKEDCIGKGSRSSMFVC